ncbi:hypothetical protein [Streptomyces phytohabitans]|uniref:hypothetical protein n=1 Tax=Streptomyces phytohabitans TaxID=1150371 RepID=UPI00345C2385
MNARHLALGAVLLTGLALTGCGRDTSDGSLDVQSATPSPTCRVHQTEEPGDQYTGRSDADPRAVLELMRYYTANGAKPFCDDRAPTGTDRRWADLYSQLGGGREHVVARDSVKQE